MKHYAPGTSGSPPELTEMERITLEASRQLAWAKSQLALYADDEAMFNQMAYYRGYRDALKGVLSNLRTCQSWLLNHNKSANALLDKEEQ